MTCDAECKQPAGRACHCAACHHTFGSLRLFDAHHDVDYQRPGNAIRCRSPWTLGLARDPWGTWRTPEGVRSLGIRIAAMKKART
jgi:hypothetical protein